MKALIRQGDCIVIRKNLMYWYNRLKAKGYYCSWCGNKHVAMKKISK